MVFLLFASLLVANNVQGADRISGENRYSTAVKISQEGWKNANVVVLARGDSFPDALAGGPLAYYHNAPILLTNQNSLHAETKKEIQRLRATKIVILGGTAAVSERVADSLENMGMTIERISGKIRFATAAQIAKQLPSTRAIVANGSNFPDALAIAPFAAKSGTPILLTNQEKLLCETEQASAGKSHTTVVGGVSAVSNEVASKLPNATRISGKDRYATAHAIITQLPMQSKTAYLATGKQFADALSGSVLAAKQNASILLTDPAFVPNIVRETVTTKDYSKIIAFDGESAVSGQTANELSTLTLVDGDISKVNSAEWEVYKIVNQERQKQNLSPLRLHVDLGGVALIKSKDMHDNTSPTYGSPFDMMASFGLDYWSAGENIAASQSDPSNVMNSWMNSPGHKANILSTNYTHIGVGHHYGSKG